MKASAITFFQLIILNRYLSDTLCYFKLMSMAHTLHAYYRYQLTGHISVIQYHNSVDNS